jgi:hypothetical protein
MQKNCIICGAPFVPHKNLKNRQKCCSPECSIKNRYEINKRWNSKPENIERQHRIYQERTKNLVVCKICGKPTEAVYPSHRTHYHDECIINEAIEIIKSGNKLTQTQYNRLFLRGYTLKYITEIMRESEENGK